MPHSQGTVQYGKKWIIVKHSNYHSKIMRHNKIQLIIRSQCQSKPKWKCRQMNILNYKKMPKMLICLLLMGFTRSLIQTIQKCKKARSILAIVKQMHLIINHVTPCIFSSVLLLILPHSRAYHLNRSPSCFPLNIRLNRPVC